MKKCQCEAQLSLTSLESGSNDLFSKWVHTKERERVQINGVQMSLKEH